MDAVLQSILTRLMQRTLDEPSNGIHMTGDGRLICESFLLCQHVCSFFQAMGIECYPVALRYQQETEVRFGRKPVEQPHREAPVTVGVPVRRDYPRKDIFAAPGRKPVVTKTLGKRPDSDK